MESNPFTQLATRLGIIIIIPILVCIPIGVIIDRVYGSLPLATIGALVVAACISTVKVARVIKEQ
jgi:F0F1-type ATP synthase assembly protein I